MTKLRFCLVVLAVVVLTISALAQVQNGQFTGIVTDPSGAAIAKAKVTVLNTATNLYGSSTDQRLPGSIPRKNCRLAHTR